MTLDEIAPGGATTTIQSKCRRALWSLTWAAAASWTPRPFHAWRASLLRLFGASVGKHVHVYPGARIWAPWNLQIGDRSALADGVDCYNMARITIGADVVVSQRAFLCTATHAYEQKAFPLMAAPIALDDGVWIAAEAAVMPGVRVGRGAVVAARSLVVSDVPDDCVVAGVPAHVKGRPGRRLD